MGALYSCKQHRGQHRNRGHCRVVERAKTECSDTQEGCSHKPLARPLGEKGAGWKAERGVVQLTDVMTAEDVEFGTGFCHPHAIPSNGRCAAACRRQIRPAARCDVVRMQVVEYCILYRTCTYAPISHTLQSNPHPGSHPPEIHLHHVFHPTDCITEARRGWNEVRSELFSLVTPEQAGDSNAQKQGPVDLGHGRMVQRGERQSRVTLRQGLADTPTHR